MGYVQPTEELLSAFLDTEALDRYEAAYGKITTHDQGEGKGVLLRASPILATAALGRTPDSLPLTRYP